MSISISPENCVYRAEGNAGIVIGLIKEGRVLRLRKQDNIPKASPNASDALKDLESQIKIIRNVLKPILGKSLINEPIIVFLSGEDIKTLNKIICRFRPAYRIHKSVVEKDTYVCMLPDYCSLPQSLKLLPTYGPELSIEIKPKQGFMKEEYLPSGSSLPVLICRFCLMQRYKIKRGLISTKSKYCPIDLFSGCYDKMHHALKMLCKTPQNNLRIFKNQKLVYSEENKKNLNDLLSDFSPPGSISCTEFLCDLIIQALIKPFPTGLLETPVLSQKKFSQNCINAHALCSETAKDACHQLPLYCVLERLLSSQLLDDLSMMDLYQLYLKVKESQNKYSDFIGCYSRSEMPPFIGELKKASGESEYQYASRKVWEFLLALCIKDCSIMITLKQIMINRTNTTHMQNTISDKYGNLYVFSIAIADLDAKPLNRVEKVYNDISAMLELYTI